MVGFQLGLKGYAYQGEIAWQEVRIPDGKL
jgi:hypothetical protein